MIFYDYFVNVIFIIHHNSFSTVIEADRFHKSLTDHILLIKNIVIYIINGILPTFTFEQKRSTSRGVSRPRSSATWLVLEKET